MADLLAKFRIATWFILGLAGIALALLWAKTGAMAGWCIFPGMLIACASVAASPGRPLMLYAAFGALMGFAFWMGVSAINAGQYLNLIPSLLLLAGISWFLREPEWPSFLFTAVVDALCLGLMALAHAHRFEVPGADLETVIHTVITSVVMLAVGAVFLAVGFAEVKLVKASRRKKKSRAIRTPAGPPML